MKHRIRTLEERVKRKLGNSEPVEIALEIIVTGRADVLRGKVSADEALGDQIRRQTIIIPPGTLKRI